MFALGKALRGRQVSRHQLDGERAQQRCVPRQRRFGLRRAQESLSNGIRRGGDLRGFWCGVRLHHQLWPRQQNTRCQDNRRELFQRQHRQRRPADRGGRGPSRKPVQYLVDHATACGAKVIYLNFTGTSLKGRHFHKHLVMAKFAQCHVNGVASWRRLFFWCRAEAEDGPGTARPGAQPREVRERQHNHYVDLCIVTRDTTT